MEIEKYKRIQLLLLTFVVCVSFPYYAFGQNFENCQDYIVCVAGIKEAITVIGTPIELVFGIVIVMILVCILVILMLVRKNKDLEIAKHEIELSRKKYVAITKNKAEQFFELDLQNDIMYILNRLEEDDQETITVLNMPGGLVEMGLIEEDSIEAFYQTYNAIKYGATTIKKEIQYSKDGEGFKWYEMFITHVRGKDSRPWAVGIFDDVSDHKERVHNLRKIAETDMMTGVYNKVAVETKISKAIQSGEIGTFIIYDIDNFKYINDTYGHPSGDKLLKLIGSVLNSCFRDTDIIGRIGGDEFVVFMRGAIEKELVARKTNESLLKIGGLKDILNWDMDVFASMGIAIMPEDGSTLDELYKNADSNMYKAKKDRKQQGNEKLNLNFELSEDLLV